MKSVLIDTGPLVALLDARDTLHQRALRELEAIRQPLVAEVPVLTEAHFLLRSSALRRRLADALERGVFVTSDELPATRLRYALRWLGEYAEHAPDFADAWVVASADLSRSAVWTFDSEFKTVWRTLAGKRLKLVP